MTWSPTLETCQSSLCYSVNWIPPPWVDLKKKKKLWCPTSEPRLGSSTWWRTWDSTTSALLPIFARVVSGFNQRKPPSRAMAIAVSHRLFIEMINRSWLRHHLVKLLLAYLRGRKASCVYQQDHLPSCQVRAGVAQESVISPALFNHLVSDCPITDLDMRSSAGGFMLMASAPSIVEDEARANQLCSILVRWADGKQPAITLLHRIGNGVVPLNKTPKVLGITLDTHFTFSPQWLFKSLTMSSEPRVPSTLWKP